MDTKVDRTTDSNPVRDEWLRQTTIAIAPVPSRRSPVPRHVVVRTVTEMHALGMTRQEIARELGMTAGYNGSLQQALRRARRLDLLAAITPPRPGQPAPKSAAERLAAPAEDLPVDDSDEAAPKGRLVRGPGGVVRWVAA